MFHALVIGCVTVLESVGSWAHILGDDVGPIPWRRALVLVLNGHQPSQHQVPNVKRPATYLSAMEASQVLLVLGKTDYDHVVYLVEQVDGKLCICSCLYIVIDLSPWGVVL